MTANFAQPIIDSGWVYRLHPPKDPNPSRLCVFMHGWTGDEFSMDIFLRAVPPDYSVVSPRAPFTSEEGGYGWVTFRPGTLAPITDFQITARNLLTKLDRWIEQHQLPDNPLTLVGFSQGAAMALATALAYPDRIEQVACLSGFLPKNGLPTPSPEIANGMKVFISHGTQDPIIPVERAREAADWLQAAGAQVTRCESNVGHRLDAACFRLLRDFLA